MCALLLTAALAGGPVETVCYSSAAEAVPDMAGELPTGTLLFSKGDCLAVRAFTQSPYTHVAAVVVEDGRPYVYDSQNGVGVRRLMLAEYLQRQSPDRLLVCVPRQAFSERRTELLVNHLRQELGRPYAVAHHLTGERADGLHCAEYVTDALIHCRLVRANAPPRVSPASLRTGLLKGNLYDQSQVVVIRPPQPPPKKGDGWCEQLWLDTVACTKSCCGKMSGWFLCK